MNISIGKEYIEKINSKIDVLNARTNETSMQKAVRWDKLIDYFTGICFI